MIPRPSNYHTGVSRLVFAGQESLSRYQQMAVKFETNSGFSTRYASKPRRLEVRLLDRTLFFYGKSTRAFTLLEEPCDAVVSLSKDMTHLKTNCVDMILMNHLNAPSNLDTRSYVNNGIDVIFDSGGFQLVQGTSDFVSPDDPLSVYNHQATIGVGLDFPAGPDVDAILFKENTALQVMNNAYIRARLNPSVSLAPVVHGATPKTRRWCLDAVYSKTDKSVCVSGLAIRVADSPQQLLQKFANLALVLDRVRQDADYVHLLGATSALWLTFCSFLSQSGYVKSIGGDSVSHRQAAIGGSYNTYPHFAGAMSLIQPQSPKTPAALPCPCPVCSLAGDARVLRDYRSSETHHLYVAAATKRVIDAAVAGYLSGLLSRSELWAAALGTTSRATRQAKVADTVLTYFENVRKHGYRKVPKLAPETGFSNNVSGLFAGGVSQHTKTAVARYRTIHKRYADFHGQDIV